MKTKLFLMCVMAASAAYSGAAMPTEAEVEKAVPKVERMLASEKVALASGKMTRAEVAEAAMKLAAGADDEAAKLLLMKGAFILLVKDGDLEKAVKTMNALETAIADMSPQVVTNIIETALLGLPNKAANGARLYRLLDESKVSARRTVVDGENLKAVVDGCTWSYRENNGEAEIVAEKDGKFSCAVSPSPTGSISIPSILGGAKVTSIGKEAFKGCCKLTSMTMPGNVINIGNAAFYDCSNMIAVKLPHGLVNIGANAFMQCRKLAPVTIPVSVTNIGEAAFAYCLEMKHIDVEVGNRAFTSIDGVVYTKDRAELVVCPSGVTSVAIPDSVVKIRSGSFTGCEGLMSLTIPSAVKSIGAWAFSGSRLTSLTLPQGLSVIEDATFWGCHNLMSVTIPDSVTSIGGNAFRWCGKLTSVTIPKGVKSIGGEAFYECGGLMSITMCGERPDAPSNVFKGCRNLKSIHVPANAKSWAGMKEWQGVPLVFDGEAKGVPEMTPVEREFKIGVAPGTVVEVDIGGLDQGRLRHDREPRLLHVWEGGRGAGK